MLVLEQGELDGKWYVNVYLFGNLVQTYHLSRQVSKEELEEMAEISSKRLAEKIEHGLLYGKEEQNGN